MKRNKNCKKKHEQSLYKVSSKMHDDAATEIFVPGHSSFCSWGSINKINSFVPLTKMERSNDLS